MRLINPTDIPETKQEEEGIYRIANLVVSETELEESLRSLEEVDIKHRVYEYENVDTTDWPGQPDGTNTIHAVYARQPDNPKTLVTGGTQ